MIWLHKNQVKSILNNSNLIIITSNSYNYGVELRYGFSGVFNDNINLESECVFFEFKNNKSYYFLDFNALYKITKTN